MPDLDELSCAVRDRATRAMLAQIWARKEYERADRALALGERRAALSLAAAHMETARSMLAEARRLAEGGRLPRYWLGVTTQGWRAIERAERLAVGA